MINTAEFGKFLRFNLLSVDIFIFITRAPISADDWFRLATPSFLLPREQSGDRRA